MVMNKYILLLGVFSLMLFSGCAGINSDQVKTDSIHTNINGNINGNNSQIMINSGLAVEKLTIYSKNGQHEFQVEMAKTDKQRQIGLMNRPNMDENKGMLFHFNTQGYLYFWMKNTLISLDILFIDKEGIIQHIAHNVPPCISGKDDSCSQIASVKPVQYVLEINGGLAEKLQIMEGDQASWNK